MIKYIKDGWIQTRKDRQGNVFEETWQWKNDKLFKVDEKQLQENVKLG